MKSFLALTGVFVLTAWSLAAETANEHAEKIKALRKMIALTGGSKVVNQLLDAMAAKFTDPKQQQMFLEFRKQMDIQQIYDIMIPSYDKYLTLADVREITRFYESPVGKKLIDAQPQIMADSVPRIVEWSQQMHKKLLEKMKESEKGTEKDKK